MIQPGRTAWNERVALLAILLLALFLRVYRIGEESLWADERAVYVPTRAADWSAFSARMQVTDPPVTPVYWGLLYGWSRVVGIDESVARIPFLAFGLGTVALTWLLGRQLYGVGPGLLAALFVACSRAAIYVSQELRAYSIVWFLGTLALIALTRWLTAQQRAAPGRRRSWLALNVLCNSLLPLTHWFGALCVVAQAVYLLGTHGRSPRSWLTWAALHVPGALLTLLCVAAVDFQSRGMNMGWSPQPTPTTIGEMLTTAIVAIRISYPGGLTGHYHPGLVVLFWLPIVLYLVRKWTLRSAPGAPPLKPELLLMLWWTVPVMTLAVLAAAVSPCFVGRYATFRVPAFCVLLAGSLFGLFRLGPRWLGATLLAPVLGVTLLAAALDVTLQRPMRANERAAGDLLCAHVQEGDALIAPYPYNLSQYCILLQRRKIEKLDLTDLPGKALNRAVLDRLQAGRTVWLFMLAPPATFQNLPAWLRGYLEQGFGTRGFARAHAIRCELHDQFGVNAVHIEEFFFPGPQMLWRIQRSGDR